MVQPRQEFLGPITVLDEDASGTVNATGAELVNVTVVLNSLAAQPTTGAGSGAFWVEDGTPTIARFTDSAGTTITLNDAGTDANAIHDNTSGEILAIPEKAIPDNDDVLIIEDSNDGYSKRRLAIGNLPGGGTGGETLEQTLVLGNTTGPHWILVENGYGINSAVDGDSIRLQAGGTTSGAMQISCGTNPAGAGGNLAIASGISTSGGNGGTININSGSSSDVGLGGSGGNIYVSSGDGDLNGGTINLAAGFGTDGSGGSATMLGGPGNAGGQVYLRGGDGVLIGGQVYAGAGNSSGDNGGEIYITSGDGYLAGGEVTIVSGSGTNGDGGRINITSGSSADVGLGGSGGVIWIQSGDGDLNGGTINLAAGYGTDGSGGAVQMLGGPGNAGGQAYISGGIGVAIGGQVYIGAGSGSAGNGGEVYITAGAGSVTGGRVTVVAGDGLTGGSITISAGLGDDGYYGDTLIRGNDINLETDGLFLRAGLYRTLSFFEHTNLDGSWLPASQAGEIAMFRVDNALAFWDDTNNIYAEITDRVMPTP